MADFQKDVFVEILPSCSRGPLDVHDSINITCHTYHFGEVKWYKIETSSKLPKEITDKVTTNQNRVRFGHWEKNSTLTLRAVTQNDAGAYVCWKSNGFNATRNVTVFIDVAGKTGYSEG